jgi:hypothetical protein
MAKMAAVHVTTVVPEASAMESSLVREVWESAI